MTIHPVFAGLSAPLLEAVGRPLAKRQAYKLATSQGISTQVGYDLPHATAWVPITFRDEAVQIFRDWAHRRSAQSLLDRWPSSLRAGAVALISSDATRRTPALEYWTASVFTSTHSEEPGAIDSSELPAALKTQLGLRSTRLEELLQLPRSVHAFYDGHSIRELYRRALQRDTQAAHAVLDWEFSTTPPTPLTDSDVLVMFAIESLVTSGVFESDEYSDLEQKLHSVYSQLRQYIETLQRELIANVKALLSTEPTTDKSLLLTVSQQTLLLASIEQGFLIDRNQDHTAIQIRKTLSAIEKEIYAWAKRQDPQSLTAARGNPLRALAFEDRFFQAQGAHTTVVAAILKERIQGIWYRCLENANVQDPHRAARRTAIDRIAHASGLV